MKIKTNNNKIYIVIAVIIALSVVGYVVYAKSASIWPFSQPNVTNDTSSNTPPAGGSPTDSPTPSDPNTGSPDATPDSAGGGQTVTTPEITKPTISAAYPIENAHYKIEQVNATTFSATLYPISGTEYDSQLKQYKEEVLSYLSQRYNSTQNLTVKWTPTSAENI